jgi:hypothetical protein
MQSRISTELNLSSFEHAQERHIPDAVGGEEDVRASIRPISANNLSGVTETVSSSFRNNRILAIGASQEVRFGDESGILAPGEVVRPQSTLEDVHSSSPPRETSFGENQPANSDADRDLAEGNGLEGVELEDDVRSDSGMTMESYDPSAFDFPRNVNDAMVHVLSSDSSTIRPEETPTVSVSSHNPRDNHEVSEGFGFARMDEDAEAPPTYDQVTSEISNERVQAQPPSTAPSTNDAQRPSSPPPAFEHETPQPTPVEPHPPSNQTDSSIPVRTTPTAPGQNSSQTLPTEGQ